MDWSTFILEVIMMLFLLFQGGHINPAVSLAMVILGRLHIRKLPFYWTAQYIGAILGSVCVFAVYRGIGSMALRAFNRHH